MDADTEKIDSAIRVAVKAYMDARASVGKPITVEQAVNRVVHLLAGKTALDNKFNGCSEPHANGVRRHGQYEWHNGDCLVRTGAIGGFPPARTIWCITHGQWASETPVSRTYTFQDGTEVKTEL